MLSATRYWLLTLLAAASWALGQTPAPTPPPAPVAQTAPAQPATAVEMPSDPAALLALAAKKNGLQNLTAPWHLKASFEVFDEKGQTTDSGSFEESWVSGTKSRWTYSSPAFNQTSIEGENGIYREGESGVPRGAASLVKSTLFHRVAIPRDNGRDKVTLEDRTLGGVKLKCVAIEKLLPPPALMTGTDCFDDSVPVLRIQANAGASLQTLYNQVVIFQGIYIAKNIELKAGAKTVLHIHIDALGPYAAQDNNQFTPRPQAVYSPRRVSNPGPVMAGDIVRKVQPQYPEFAKQQRIQGVVILSAVISKEGKIDDLQPIFGPKELFRASEDAVRQWEYKPYLLDGVPVEVETEINVVYALSSR